MIIKTPNGCHTNKNILLESRKRAPAARTGFCKYREANLWPRCRSGCSNLPDSSRQNLQSAFSPQTLVSRLSIREEEGKATRCVLEKAQTQAKTRMIVYCELGNWDGYTKICTNWTASHDCLPHSFSNVCALQVTQEELPFVLFHIYTTCPRGSLVPRPFLGGGWERGKRKEGSSDEGKRECQVGVSRE